MVLKYFSVFLSLFMIAAKGWSEEVPFSDKATGDWGGTRTCLQKKGYEFGLTTYPEFFRNFRGGIRCGNRGAVTTDLSLTIDMEKRFDWKGGKFYVDFEDRAGPNPTLVLVGDLQIFDVYNYTPYFELYELWYEQKFCKDKLRIKIGKVDANLLDFCVIENGLAFINSATQVTPTILAFPTTPDPCASINVFFKPDETCSLGLAIYDANRRDKFGIFDGTPQDNLITRTGAFLISETGFFWKKASFFKEDGNLKLGVWRHTGIFQRFEGGHQNGAIGYYVILNQKLWRPEFASFFSYGSTQKSVGILYRNFSGGITWTGFLESRKEDILGFSANYSQISPDAKPHYPYELALEWLYRIQLYKWTFLDNDLQYIIHPGGQYPNALVLTLHLKMDF